MAATSKKTSKTTKRKRTASAVQNMRIQVLTVAFTVLAIVYAIVAFWRYG